MSPIVAAFRRPRSVLLLFAFLLIAGAVAYRDIPKEAAPDVDIPLIHVFVAHEGISPEDAERLLLRPLERGLESIEGIEEMRGLAAQGYATLTLEFGAGFDADRALAEVREEVDTVDDELPADSDEPRVEEVNIALFPVLTAALSGEVPERRLVEAARTLRDELEALEGVLEVDIGGDREEVLEILVDPAVLTDYELSFEALVRTLQRNNRLVAAGTLDTERGRIALEVPGVIETPADVLELPLTTVGERVITFADVATVRRTFREPEGFARVDGAPAVALEIRKRVGANIIATVAAARAVVEQHRAAWGDRIEVTYLQDQSEDIRQAVSELENNVLAAVVLVMLVVVATLGPSSGLLVGLAIPGAFLSGILVLYAMGYTLNIIALFSLILVVGMLVDGAIVVVELASRRIAAGMAPREAYLTAARRMAWPVIASVATTLAVFVPLLFWPGIVGDFMKYLPITVIVTLIASLAMALIFVPVVGGVITRRQASVAAQADPDADLSEPLDTDGRYGRLLVRLVTYPGRVLALALVFLGASYLAYLQLGEGIEFFPEIDPEFAQVQIRARGDLSVWEKDALVRRVEARLDGIEGVESRYARTLGSTRGMEDYLPPDTIGLIQLDFADWRERPPSPRIMTEIRERVSAVPGVRVHVAAQESGPGAAKPIQLRVTGSTPEELAEAVARIRSTMDRTGGFVDVEDTRPLPGIEWRLEVDHEAAARFGADVTLLGQAVRLLTGGIELGEYRPDDADRALPIRVRFPYAQRSLDQLDALRIPTPRGHIPITNFVQFEPAPQTGTLHRVDGRRTLTIKADVATGRLVDDQVRRLRTALAAEDVMPPGVTVRFAGEDEDVREAARFLTRAFVAAVFIMALVLVTQFDSFVQALIVLSAILFSTAGVLLGLLVTGQAFGVVMGGIALIALAGVVVNDNIVLIDTFDRYRAAGAEPRTAAIRTALQRARPVILTSVTTVLGLMPMVLALTIDLIGRDVAFGAPSSQWWTQLSSGIAGGLVLATAVTLLLTPALLVLASGRQRPDEADSVPAPTPGDTPSADTTRPAGTPPRTPTGETV